MARKNGKSDDSDEKKLNFKELLKTQVQEFPEGKDLPTGTYRAKIAGAKPNEEKGFVGFAWQPLEAQDDVDSADLQAYIDSEGWDDARVFQNAWVNKRRDVRDLLALLTRMGVQTVGRTFEESIEASKGLEAFIEVIHKPRDDADGVYVNVRKVLPLEG